MECACQLQMRGWSVTHMNDSRANVPNTDLMIQKDGVRRAIQVKCSRKPKGYVTGGSVNPKVLAGSAIFNRVLSEAACDYVVFLATENEAWRYFVVPVHQAEALFRKNIDALISDRHGWMASPRSRGVRQTFS